MRYCPNSTCPYAQRHHRSAVYADDENTCHDCGTALFERGPVSAGHLTSGFGLNAGGPTHPLNRKKWALTLFVPMALLVFGFMPLLPQPAFSAVASYSLFGGRLNYAPEASFLAVGLSGFVLAFIFVECISVLIPRLRHLRNEAEGRRKLERASLGVGSLFTLVISLAMATYLGDRGGHGILLIAAPFFVAHFSIAVLLWATRTGRANAISIYLAIQMLLALGAKFGKGSVQTGGAIDSIHNLIIVFGTLIVLALLTDRVFDEKRLWAGRSKASKAGEVDKPFSSVPIVGISAIAAGVVLAQSLGIVTEVMRPFISMDQYLSLRLFVQRNSIYAILVLAGILFFVFAYKHWPSKRISRAMSAVTGKDVSILEVDTGKKDRLIKEGLLLAFVGFLAQTYFSLGIVNYITVVSLVAIARDLRAERNAEKLHGELTFVGRLSAC